MDETAVHACEAPGLALADRVGCYCERGLDPSFWAEPANALSNLGFLAAAGLAWWHLRRSEPASGRAALYGFVVLLVMIGIGSFAFHTYATVGARLADVIPIGLFVFAYMGLALAWFLRLAPILAWALAAFVTAATFLMPPWLNGSFFYLPALAMLIVTAASLIARGHGAGRWIAGAASLFALALVLRTFDRAYFVCGAGGLGTHWAWHTINAVVLYLLLRAAIDYAPARAPGPAVSRPSPESAR